MGLQKIYTNRAAILEGHINELKAKANLLTDDEDLVFMYRAKICKTCPLKKGNKCDPRKWIHPKSLHVVGIKTQGYINGCGCRLSAKIRSKKSICPAKFWGGEFYSK